MLILLVESGAVYCGMWVLVAAYAFSATFGKTSAQAAPAWHAFTYYLTNGCLISLVVRFFHNCEPAVQSPDYGYYRQSIQW